MENRGSDFELKKFLSEGKHKVKPERFALHSYSSPIEISASFKRKSPDAWFVFAFQPGWKLSSIAPGMMFRGGRPFEP
jgi:hypothetical protein